MGIKGTVRRNQDGHFIHANIDLDIIITEEPEIGGRGGLMEEVEDDCLVCGLMYIIHPVSVL